ncbi:MAG TPA: AbrB/MazE/SpoVT family DNA-binding domain-containing protein [Candidatus Caccousia avistercoris]|nr:AbrB/MazE/SpoVT family DNA-binding domain-containing protein [Candidatus Caccousia avistercoris]
MKSTGIVRPIDNLGRIVIPTELRRNLNINDKDPLEIFVDGNCIILKKYQPSCVFCNSMDDISTYMGYNVCRSCMEKLGRQARED